MNKSYRTSWITYKLFVDGFVSKSDYYDMFIDEYNDPTMSMKQMVRDFRVVKDVFSKNGNSEVVYNKEKQRYEVE